MSSPDFLIQATLKRFFARTERLVREGPDRLRHELKLFYEEVITEADLMEQESSSEEVVEDVSSFCPTDIDQPQEIVDRLRAKVADLSHKLDI